MSATATADVSVEVLNSLLHGELSAVETYGQAIEQFECEHSAAELHRIRDEHQAAVDLLRHWVTEEDGHVANGAGPWGIFASAVVGTAKAIGPATVLHALRQGEMHGIDEYEAALAHDELEGDCKNAIRSQLLPRCQSHVLDLDHLMAGK